MGRIHAGRSVKPGGRYDRFLKLLSAAGGKGATTLEVVRGAGVCAVNSIAAELRVMGYDIECEAEGVSADGGRIYRYRWLKNVAQGGGPLIGESLMQGTLFSWGDVADPRKEIV